MSYFCGRCLLTRRRRVEMEAKRAGFLKILHLCPVCKSDNALNDGEFAHAVRSIVQMAGEQERKKGSAQ